MAKKRKKAKKAPHLFLGMYSECGRIDQLVPMEDHVGYVTGVTADDVRKKIDAFMEGSDFCGGKYAIVQVLDVGSASQVVWNGPKELI